MHGAKTRLPGWKNKVKSKLDALDQQILSWQYGAGLLWLPASVLGQAERRQEEPAKAAAPTDGGYESESRTEQNNQSGCRQQTKLFVSRTCKTYL